MRASTMLSMLLPLSLFAAHADAKEPPAEIFLSGVGAVPTTTTGEVSIGESRSFTLKLTSDRSVTFALNANNDTCGYELKKSSELGFLPGNDRFPVSYTDTAKQGEVYTISFHQSRSAWIDKKRCAFSFSVR